MGEGKKALAMVCTPVGVLMALAAMLARMRGTNKGPCLRNFPAAAIALRPT